jgi:hypothetical protein
MTFTDYPASLLNPSAVLCASQYFLPAGTTPEQAELYHRPNYTLPDYTETVKEKWRG